MPHIYDHVFEQFRIVDPDDNDRSIVDDFAGRSQWLETPGCLFQRNNVVLGSRIRTEGVIKAGLFISVILKGAGSGRARKGANWISYSDASLVVMAFREPTLWDGDAPRGAHMQAAGVAFPVASLERLGLMDEFIDLFDSQESKRLRRLAEGVAPDQGHCHGDDFPAGRGPDRRAAAVGASDRDAGKSHAGAARQRGNGSRIRPEAFAPRGRSAN